MARPGLAEKGQSIALLTNHLKFSVQNIDKHFFHYSVNLKDQDGQPIGGKGIGRKVIDEMERTNKTELGNNGLAYDGEKALFTISRLPQINNEFPVMLDNLFDFHVKHRLWGKTFKVELSLVAKIPIQSIESSSYQEALRVLVIMLRQHAVKKGCHLVRRSFFHDNQSNYTDLGGGVIGCRGFHSSLRLVQGGLSLNIDVSTTIIVRPGPVIDFLIANQNVRDPLQVDWGKAKRTLKNLRVKIRDMECKITGLSELPCNQQTFTFKPKGDSEVNAMEITVYEYYVSHRRTPLSYSADLPCIKVGKSKNPAYFPIEVCNLVSLQRYTKGLTVQQRASFVEKSRQKPQERMSSITNALKYMKYDSDPMLQVCGGSISLDYTQVEGRVLQPPKLIFGNGEEFLPRNGRWNLYNKKLFTPIEVDCWAVVNFSDRSDTNSIIHDLITCGSMKGITFKQPLFVFEENPYMRRALPAARVEDMFYQIMTNLHEPPKFILCLLSSKRNSLIYGPWKRKCLVEFGIVTQCMAPKRVDNQYLTNLLLKINAKLGGMNSLLQLENITAFPIVSKAATIILGMDVSHGSPGRSDVPSIAAVVSSRQWPLISKYRASVRTQSPKEEMIDSIFKLVSRADGKGTYDDGIIR
ncbi:protein argonaute 4B-like [Dendrobium catenatum]|uniref:protein argonaute 4B-like n=1 Tax=Dendrobium catenatum TaxID=906689 RepID=UPI00109F8909|nr:protein argonaute 4B-like [Dendrobium catenatum]